MTKAVFDESPTVAIKTDANGKKSIIEFGNKALILLKPDTISCNPFSHPRTLLVDLLVAQKLLEYSFKQVKSSTIFSPIVIIHPMEKVEGDLVTVERQGFITVGKNAGAKYVLTYVGDEYSGEILKGIYSGEISRMK